MIQLKTTGLKELDDVLKQFPEKLQLKALKNATRQGAIQWRNEARRLAPRGKRKKWYGFLEKIMTRNQRSRRTMGIHLKEGIEVGVGRKHNLARSLLKTWTTPSTAYTNITYIVGLMKGAMHGVPVFWGHKQVIFTGKKEDSYTTRGGKVMKGWTVRGEQLPEKFMTDAEMQSQRVLTNIKIALQNYIGKMNKNV